MSVTVSLATPVPEVLASVALQADGSYTAGTICALPSYRQSTIPELTTSPATVAPPVAELSQ